jgi:hypothetical protein
MIGGWLVPAGRAVGTVLRDPVIVILLLAGAAELLAGDPLVDGLVLLAVAAALARDRVRGRPPGGVPIAAPEWADRLVRARPTPALVIGGLLYSVAAGGLARFSWPVMVAVAVPGVVGVASAWLLQPSLTTGSPAHPTISILLDPLLGSHPGRSVGFAAWLALGWFLVRR